MTVERGNWWVEDLKIDCVLMTNEMHNSYNQFLFHSFLSALHVSNESSHSSSGAQHNIPIVPNCVIQYILP